MNPFAAIRHGLRQLAVATSVRSESEARAGLAAPVRPPVQVPLLQTVSIPRSRLLILASLCALLFTLRLGAPFLYDDGEARYATAVREMAQTGEWLEPRFQGHPIRKPPLVFWLMRGARAALGEGEAAARLPSAAAGVVAVLGTAALGARFFGAPVGFLAGVLLATMFQFIWVARKGQIDMPLTAFVVLAQALLFRALEEGRGRWWVGGYACVALGTMAKGLAGVVLPLGTVGLYALLVGRGRELWRREAMLPAAAGAAAAVVYYAALGSGFVTVFLYEDHVHRFVAGVDVAEPLWWYGPILVLGILPYAGWLPFAAVALVSEQGRRFHRAATFAACWFALWFVLISASAGKQEQYIVPLLPSLAMLMAAGMLRVAGRRPGWWARAGIAAAPATVAVGSAIFLGYLARQALLTVWPATAFSFLALAGIVGAWGAFRWPVGRAIRGAVACGVLTSLAVITAALPPFERARAAAPMAAAQAIREVVGQARVVSYGGPYTPTPRVTFYLNTPRPLRRLDTPDELDRFLRSDRTSYLLLPQPAWEALERARRLGRPVAAKVSTGRADYILLAPPALAGTRER